LSRKLFTRRISNALDFLFDSNVWLALTFSSHPHHSLAKEIFAILHEAEFITLDRDFKNFEKDGLKLRLLTS
jgi:predicted nucleic acid-binding protein